jgi:hypothetical protein
MADRSRSPWAVQPDIKRLSLNYGAAHFDIKNDDDAVAKITARIRECRKEFPDQAEFTMELRGVWYFGIYTMQKDGTCEVHIMPEDVATEILRPLGLTAVPGQ